MVSTAISFASDAAYRQFDGLSILVTGGTGSFGRQFISALLAKSRPRRIAVFSRDEFKQHEMQQQVKAEDQSIMRFFIGDVRDVDRLDMALREVDIVVHAAALKHVPAAEYNPFECIRTNVNGAENVAMASIRNRVKKVLALSTDKAAGPINLYGASKLASDKIFIAANNLSGSVGTRFAVVRYGNVVGSRGSVIPFFRKLIADGATSLPITDDRMTRFWISLGQGIDFVVSSLSMMRGGEIFVPKIPSMSIVEVARFMAPNLPHHIVGIRPGEKLHEAMITEDDSYKTTALKDRYVIEPSFNWWDSDTYRSSGGQAVTPGFKYTSETNSQWLDATGLAELLRIQPP